MILLLLQNDTIDIYYIHNKQSLHIYNKLKFGFNDMLGT